MSDPIEYTEETPEEKADLDKYEAWFDSITEEEQEAEIKNLLWQARIIANSSPDSSLPGRNDPCPCGSGKKFKKCCIDKVI